MYKNIFIIVCLLTASAFPWEFIGPEDSLEITNLYCFGGGHILAFAGETPDDNPLLFRSRDYGDTWDSITDCGLPRTCTVDYQIFFYNNRLLAGPGNGASNKGIFFSEDSGNTWIKDSAIHCGGGMAYSFAAKDSILLVGTYGFFSRSTDYGKTYKDYILIPGLEHDIGAVFCLMAFRDVVYAGTQYGIFASKDWGLTWEKRGYNTTGPGGTIFSLEMIDTVILMSSGAGAFCAYDLGQNTDSWKDKFLIEADTHIHLTKDDKVFIHMIQPTGICTMHYSKDTGKTYQPFSITTPEMYIHKIQSDDKYVYVMGVKGIYRNLLTDSPTKNNPQNKMLTYSSKGEMFFVKNNILHFDVKHTGFMEIKLYTLNGQIVFAYTKAIQVPRILKINIKKYSLGPGIYAAQAKLNSTAYTSIIAIR